jgi:hypothetical protein
VRLLDALLNWWHRRQYVVLLAACIGLRTRWWESERTIRARYEKALTALPREGTPAGFDDRARERKRSE